MKRVALFGGSFNPITKGHIKVANAVLKKYSFDCFWFMPCYNHNLGKSLECQIHRMEMIEKAIKSSRNKKMMEVCRYEIVKQSEGKTYNTLTELTEQLKFINFTYVIGMDCAIDIKKWYKWRKLINEFNFIVVERKGYECEDINRWFDHKPHKVLRIDCGSNYSSTEARKAILTDDKELMEKLMYKNVVDYINTQGLYK